jgi:hypothetical protein
MTTPQIKEYNCETGEEIIRDANAEEIAQMKIDAQKLASEQAEVEAKAQAKTAAQAKLAALGLTVEDLQALGL